MTCPIRTLLERFDNGDREQLRVIVADTTRSVHMIALSLTRLEPNPLVTVTTLLRHRHETCSCFGYVD